MKIGFSNTSYLKSEPIPFPRNDQVVFGTKEDILDDFVASATLIESEGRQFFWITYDLGIIRTILADEVYKRLCEVTDKVKRDDFIMMATHTHSGPQPYRFPTEASHDPRFVETPDTLFTDLVNDMGDAAKYCYQKCSEGLCEVTAKMKNTVINGVYSNRNGLDEPCDKNFTLIRFYNKETDEFVGQWMNMSCHSTVIHPRNEKMSSDLVGVSAKKLAKLSGVYPQPFCGCQGDTSTRLTRHKTTNAQEDYQQLEDLTNQLVDQVKGDEGFEEIQLGEMILENITMSYDYEVEKDEAKKKLDNILARQAAEPDEHHKFLYHGNIKIFNQRLGATRYHDTLESKILKLGDLKIVFVNGELVNELGLTIVKHDIRDTVLIAGYWNRETGYWVNQYENNFESIARIMPVGLPKVMVIMILERLDALKQLD